MRGPRVQAFLFDLDGVLVDTTRIIHKGWSSFAAARGVTVPEADYPRAIYGRRTHEILTDYFRLAPDEADSLIAGGLDDKSDMVASDGLVEIAGASAFVRAAKTAGLRVALASSASAVNVKLALQAIGLNDAFEAVVTSADVRRGKPAPEPYVAAARALDVDTSQAVVFEDTIPGIMSARAAGARCVAVATTMDRSDLSDADLVIDSFERLDPAEVIRALGD